MNRKAMTPIISTIILILFAAGLGTVVMSWGKDSVTGTYGCDGAQIEIVEIDGKPSICYRGDEIEFTLLNTGETELTSLNIAIIGQDIENKEYDGGFKPGNAKKFIIPNQNKDIKKVIITPKSNNVICGESNIQAEDPEVC